MKNWINESPNIRMEQWRNNLEIVFKDFIEGIVIIYAPGSSEKWSGPCHFYGDSMINLKQAFNELKEFIYEKN